MGTPATQEQKLPLGASWPTLSPAVRHTGTISHNGSTRYNHRAALRSTIEKAQVFIANFGKMVPVVQPPSQITAER